MMNNVRCDIPFCWTNDMYMIKLYKQCIHRIHSKKLLTIVSNSIADRLYTKEVLGIMPVHIPSLCLYANIQYNPSKATFLCYNGDIPNHPLVTHRRDLGRFEWSDVGSFKGVIHFPYEPNTMSIFEHFTGGLPLFFPSKTYWKSHPNIQSISAYWGDRLPQHLNMFRNTDFWIETSDVYTTFVSPNTYYFDSIPHLFELLETFAYIDDRDIRDIYKQSVQKQWKHVITQILTL